MDLTTAPRGELIALIYELTDKVEILEAEVARLKNLLHPKGDDKELKNLPAFVKPNVKQKKARERKKREQTFHRAKETPTQQVFHTAVSCPYCGSHKLGKPSVAYSRQVIDLPPTPYIVTEHVIFKRWCYHCKKRVLPEVLLTQEVIGKKRVGVGLISAIAVLRDRLRLPIRVIQTYLSLFHNLHLAYGELVELLHTTAAIGRPAYQKLLETIRGSPYVCGDETGGRENGKNGYFWSFSAPTAHFLLYRKSRGKQVVAEVFGKDGEEYEGVIVSDFYAAYNEYSGFHQRCWVHFLREITEIAKTHPRHPPFYRWAKAIKNLYAEAKAYPGSDKNLPLGKAAEERIVKQHEFERKLEAFCKPYLVKETPMSTLCARAINFLPEMFVFIRFPHIPSDNNQAERMLRHTVVARKIQGGTRSSKGSETKTILTSLFDTWILQGKNPLTECRLLLTSCQ